VGKAVKIDVYTNVHNEEQILPYYLRHYEQFVDRIFIWEDESTDRSREILQAHPKVILLEPSVHGADDRIWCGYNYKQYRMLSRGVADWVMLADADEFIYHPNLLQVLEELSKDTVIIKCEGWEMMSDHLPTDGGQIYDEIKTGALNGWNSKQVIFKPELNVFHWPGKHKVPRVEPFGAKRVSNTGIKLLHYRYLGEDYWYEKNRHRRERWNRALGTSLVYEEEVEWLPDMKHRGLLSKWFADRVGKVPAVI